LTLFGTGMALASEVQDKASEAFANVFFDHDASDFTIYSVRDDGFLDITFVTNTSDGLCGEILARLRAHPNIWGVLAGKSGPICSRW
jgi:hypothetical protein